MMLSETSLPMKQSMLQLIEQLEAKDITDRVSIQDEVADFLTMMQKTDTASARAVELAADLLKGGCDEVIFRELTNSLEVLANGSATHFDKPETIVYNALRAGKMDGITLKDALIKRMVISMADHGACG
ncbi:hypothetical protein, variant [Sphaeroforma arctica JP610]|uniref:Uncharacterized protein n=1 Tax=Sphaeroforma arctica JP610 TaxID=667725 RepID=A0A0L0G2R1_9EUKA|nr:hypothetical protein, variant [Sphaeroforma arctica JP610]KNC83086.1 hypothetical protein, variant [Sphaeroforma arctica JP610]|eukprot:XP_014156988.1 hypothetical protein, variant [Sphaeroforma arctica JP610]